MQRDGKANREIILIFLIIALGTGSLSGCASAPSKPASPTAGEQAARTAVSMIGRPYRYRGDSPEGFDCSGLVRYSYLTAGVDVPHGTESLMKVTRPLSMSSARIGDLLFFKENGKKYSHVGIYLGNDLFVHAPTSSGKVKKDSLQDPHWKKSFLEVRRFN
jgi:cell wall-associated NlpC family hydrolase